MQKINEEKVRISMRLSTHQRVSYRGPVEKESRSQMNVVFRLKTPEIIDAFIKQAKSAGIVGAGIVLQAELDSIYNANLVDNIRKVVEFMEEFRFINR